jgi:hypothetical protein
VLVRARIGAAFLAKLFRHAYPEASGFEVLGVQTTINSAANARDPIFL